MAVVKPQKPNKLKSFSMNHLTIEVASKGGWKQYKSAGVAELTMNYEDGEDDGGPMLVLTGWRREAVLKELEHMRAKSQ